MSEDEATNSNSEKPARRITKEVHDIRFLSAADKWGKRNDVPVEIWCDEDPPSIDDSGWRITIKLKDANGWFGASMPAPKSKKGEEYDTTVALAMSKLCAKAREERIRKFVNLTGSLPAGKAA